MLEVGSEAPTDSVALLFKKYVMNYRNKIKKLGFEITTSYSTFSRYSKTTYYNISKNGKTLAFTSLKEAYNIIDLFFIM
jgi:hypothetical protein